MLNKLALTSICLLIFSISTCLGRDISERAFLWNEANAIMASAEDQADYLIAARAYQRLLDMGVRNGYIFYNLGTALLNAGHYENAFKALLSAERYMGGHPNITHNLKISMARNFGHEEYRMPWYRVFLFWHFKLSTPFRAVGAAIAFSLVWTLLALKKLGAGRWTLIPLTLSIILFAILGVSIMLSWLYEFRGNELKIGSNTTEFYML